jgi:dihydrofolate reductase
MTRTLTVDIFLSVDGWAGSDGLPPYFGYFGPDLNEWNTTHLEEPHLMLMGRRTYEVLADIPDEARDASWQRMTELDKVVFSRSLRKAEWENTRICADDLVGEVRRLKEESDVPLRTVGSLSVGRQLLDAGLVDRLRLMTFPLLAGPDGREAAFADVSAADLELVDNRVLDGRILLVEYRPTGEDIPRT